MEIYLTFMGEDFIAEVEYTVTYAGCAAQTYGPPENCYPAEGPEWEVDSITLSRDIVGEEWPAFEATGALFDCLCNDEKFIEAIERHISERDSDHYDYD